MKKTYLLILVAIFTTVSIQAQSFPTGIVVNKSDPYYVGDTIGFNKICHDSSRGTSTWDFGDGTSYTYLDDNDHGWQYHSYSLPGTYVVRYTHGVASSTPICHDGSWSGNAFTVIYRITIDPKRAVTAYPSNAKVDQLVYIQALNFTGTTVYWDFGDGTVLNGSLTQTHRYQSTGVYTITARELDVKHETIYATVTISPDDRFIQISTSETPIGAPVTVTAFNFNGDTILWNFGDGTVVIGGHTISHTYTQTGDFKIIAVDEGGESTKSFETMVKVFGLTDKVILDLAELKFDNGKYYMVVPRNSDQLKPVLKLKMKGTGVITGHWLYDGSVFGLINELSSQGEVKEITLDKASPLPTIEPGLHTVSFRLTRPATELVFPTLRYYVLPFEKSMETLTPPDGFVAKEDEIPEFSWAVPRGGAARYQIAFSNSLFDLLNNSSSLVWNDVRGGLTFTPGKAIWDGLKRNRWTYWRVRSFDSFDKVTGESGINEIKIIIAKAEITINKVTGLEGKNIPIRKEGIFSGSEILLVNGTVEYKDNSDYIILQVLVNDNMVDQLLFRDVKKGEKREFETSVPGREKGKVVFRVLKTSSPSVIVGIKGLILRR